MVQTVGNHIWSSRLRATKLQMAQSSKQSSKPCLILAGVVSSLSLAMIAPLYWSDLLSSGNKWPIRMTDLSRYMAKVLRHTASEEGIPLNSEGYAYVDDILKKRCGRTLSDVEAIVRNDPKTRFKLRDSPVTCRRQIKATQGHSFAVSDLSLTEITSPRQVSQALHGTSETNWSSIKIEGLSRRRRVHIHFATEESSPMGSSGIPGGCTIIISLDIAKAMRDGITFYRSENDVILSPGNENGVIPVACFKSVYNKSTGAKLYP